MLALIVFSQPLLRFVLTAFIPRGPAFVLIHTLPFFLILFFCLLVLWGPQAQRVGAARFGTATVWLLLIWGVLSLISVSASPFPVISLARQAIWFELVVFGICLTAYLRARPDRKEKILLLVFFGFLTYGLLLLVYLLPLPAGNPNDLSPPFPGFSNIRHFGYYAVVGMVTGMALHQSKKFGWKQQETYWFLAATAFLWSLIFWTGGRGPIVALGGAIILLLILRRVERPRDLLMFLGIAMLAGAVISLGYNLPNKHFGLLRILGFFSQALDATVDINNLSSNRWHIWQLSMAAITVKPIIGYGPDIFPFVVGSRFANFAQPHNFPIQFVLAWGAAGAGVFLAFLASLSRQLFIWTSKDRLFSWTSFAGLAGVTGLVLFGLIDGTLYHQVPLTMLVVFLALVISDCPAPSWRAAPPRLLLAMRSVTFFVATILMLHALSVYALRTEGVPGPESWRIRYLQVFPSAMWSYDSSFVVAGWVDTWKDGAPGKAREILVWDQSRVRGDEGFLLIGARIDFLDGDQQAAHAKLRKAKDSKWEFPVLIGEQIVKNYEPDKD